VVVVGILATTVIIVGYRRFLFSTFDPEVASVSGVRVSMMEAALMVMLSLTILVTMRVIGTLLISALLVIPAATARMLTNRFSRMLWIAPVIGASGAFLGMNLAYHTNTSAAAMIIIVCAAAFSTVYLGAGVRGKRRIAALGHL
jgi:manganese transport system permease protein